MTEEEKLIIRYLQKFPGRGMHFCKMLNKLADESVSYVRFRLKVPKVVRRAAWMKFQAAATRLMKAGIMIRDRTPQVFNGPRFVTVRLRADFETKSVL